MRPSYRTTSEKDKGGLTDFRHAVKVHISSSTVGSKKLPKLPDRIARSPSSLIMIRIEVFPLRAAQISRWRICATSDTITIYLVPGTPYSVTTSYTEKTLLSCATHPAAGTHHNTDWG